MAWSIPRTPPNPSRCSRCAIRRRVPKRPRSACWSWAHPIHAGSTKAWRPTSSRRSARLPAPPSAACCPTDMTDDPVSAYLSMLEHERRLSEHTLRGYTHELDELKKLANGRALESLTAAHMRGAVARAHGGGLSAPSIAHRLSALRAPCPWSCGNVEMEAHPGATRRAPQRAKALPQAPSRPHAHALAEEPPGRAPRAAPDH